MSNHRTAKASLDACTQPELINAITTAGGRNVRSVEVFKGWQKDFKIVHAVGEVVVGALEDFYDDRSLKKKARPVIILAPGGCKHTVAPLTTQAVYKSTGVLRKQIPNPAACGLSGDGYLWSAVPRPLERIDLRKHVGWVDHAMVKLLAETMRLPPKTVAQLWQAANRHHGPADSSTALQLSEGQRGEHGLPRCRRSRFLRARPRLHPVDIFLAGDDNNGVPARDRSCRCLQPTFPRTSAG